jgi:ribonuclease HI
MAPNGGNRGGRPQGKHPTSWVRSTDWAAESWPTQLSAFLLSFTESCETAANSSAAQAVPFSTSSVSSDDEDFSVRRVKLASNMQIELDVSSYGDWILYVSPPPCRWRHLVNAARAAGLQTDGNCEAPIQWFISVPRIEAPRYPDAARILLGTRKSFDPHGVVSWLGSEATPSHWLMYGEAPNTYIPANPCISAKIGERIVSVLCERRAHPVTDSVIPSDGIKPPALHVIPIALPTRPLHNSALIPDPTKSNTSAIVTVSAVQSAKIVSTTTVTTPELAQSTIVSSDMAITAPTGHPIIPASLVPAKRARGNKLYAVLVGRNTGLFSSWEDCKASVEGYSNARHRSFDNEDAACAYLAANGINPKRVPPSSTDIPPAITMDEDGAQLQSDIITPPNLSI